MPARVREFRLHVLPASPEAGKISDVPSLAGRRRLVGLGDVGFLSESRDVEPGVFFGRTDPNRGEDVDDTQKDIGPAERECRDDDAGERLNGHLAGIPEEQAVAASWV